MDKGNRRIYLDNAGAGQPSPEQIERIAEDMRNRFLSNPHSRHSTSQTTTNIVERARIQVLEYFKAQSEYELLFTAGTTQSLKLVAECFDFGGKRSGPTQFLERLDDAQNGTLFGYSTDAHTSVVGMRQVVRSDYVACCYRHEDFLALDGSHRRLIVLTAMSNFCGRKYDLNIINKLQELGNTFVCLDAAALVSCSTLDLSSTRPDFVALSFYKMFGYPTGLGVLLVRKDRCELLEKRFYGGGTVDISHPTKSFVRFRKNFTDRFEDGTINYCAIAALRHGFEDIERCGGIREIEKRTFDFAFRAAQFLQNLKHSNGTPVAVVYGSCWDEDRPESEHQGAIVNFNLLRENGSYVGYVEVEKMCDLFHIDLRTGCFCNQGACLMYLGLNDQILFGNYENGKVCGDKADLIDGRPVGSVRISFSRLSTENDLDVFKSMVECCFLHSFDQKHFPEGVRTQLAQLSQICIYPIKSCGAYRIRDSWKLNELGLEFDRLWMVVGADGVPVNQKRSRALCFIRPSISKDKMIVADADNNFASLELSLDEGKEKTLQEYIVCSDSVVTVDCGEDAAQWLESFHPDDFLGCRLLRQVNSSQHRECRVATAILNLSNQAPFLLINRASAAYLANIISLPTEEIIARFRANFVIDCETAFEEDNFAEIHVGSIEFEVISKCTRCQMICIDQETGIKDPNLLLALRDRRIGEQMTFGLYLKHRESDREKTISVGSYAKIIRKND